MAAGDKVNGSNGLQLPQRPTELRMPFPVAGDCCCQPPKKHLPDRNLHFVSGWIETQAGPVPQVNSILTHRDRWGAFKARWGIGRMNYRIAAGLYALDRPTAGSPVLVTSSYKMSFDHLRQALPGHAAWILVLDTQGINVWCAAGKGTFGTDELVSRIAASGLEKVVSHRRLILPQLAAPGVAAHLVKKRSGFTVVYGPVRAADLPVFLANGLVADRAMRIKTFGRAERIVLIPVELVAAMKASVFVLPVFFLTAGLGPGAGFWQKAAADGLIAVTVLLASILTGCLAVPALLPWLPGRAFAAKGFGAGIIAAALLIYVRYNATWPAPNWLELGAWAFLLPGITAYLAMNFTGASTYTSLSGVRREMRWA